MNIVLFGPPGSGKGTQAERLKKKYSLRHISTGDLLREAVAAGTELGKRVQSILASGELVSDDIVLELIREAVASVRDSDTESGWIMDGFPRTIGQAEALEALLAKTGEKIDAVIVLDVDRNAVIERLSARRSCPNCKAVYHLVVNPPKVDETCDRCGADIIQREDDKPATIGNRLDVYEKQTKPILGFYNGRRPVHRIDGTQTVDGVTEQIEGILG